MPALLAYESYRRGQMLVTIRFRSLCTRVLSLPAPAAAVATRLGTRETLTPTGRAIGAISSPDQSWRKGALDD